MTKTSSLAALALAAALSACGKAPGVYDLAVHDAYEKLFYNKLEDFSFAQQCGILIHLRAEGVPDQSVTWHVYSSGVEMLNFTARLTPAGDDRTKVDIEVSKDPDGTEAYSGDKTYRRPALAQPVRPAIAEAVAAVLKGRPYDKSRVPPPPEADTVCNVQRAGLESGRTFHVDDEPGTSTRRGGVR